MKTVTVMPADNMIIVDGVAVEAEFSVSPDIHAIQWNQGQGHIEYVHDANGQEASRNSQNQQSWQGPQNQQVQRILPLSEEMYSQYVAPFVAIWEQKIQENKPVSGSFTAFVEAKYEEIISRADEHMALFKARYSCCEEETWALQEAGARIVLDCEKLTKNSQALAILSQENLRERAVQLVSELAAERDIRSETMAERIVHRADSAARYSQIIYAEQRKLERLLDDLVVSGSEHRVVELPIVYTPCDTFLEA